MVRFVFVLLLMAFATGAGDPVVVGESRRIRSQVFEEDRTYRVSLPESHGWATGRRYPVLFVLDGQAHFPTRRPPSASSPGKARSPR